MASVDFSLAEGPVHEEWVRPFRLDRFAVRTGLLAQFAVATGDETVTERDLGDSAGAGRWIGSAKVGSSAPNCFGEHTMTGSSGEWTSPCEADRLRHPARNSVCSADTSRLQSIASGKTTPLRVFTGGCQSCSSESRLNYRPAAHSAQSEDSTATRLSVRCAS